MPVCDNELSRHAVELAGSLGAQAILFAVDRSEGVPWNLLSDWTGLLLIVAEDVPRDEQPHGLDLHVFDVPETGLSRIDRANLGILLASSNGLLTDDADVVCVTGPPGNRSDCIAVIRPADKFRAIFHDPAHHGTARIRPAVILRVLSIAIELASEGREGKPVGTMFVIGDTRQVQRCTRQLVLNPFHGYAQRLRSVLDPGLTETMKEFAAIDGAFIVKVDGTVLSAGTYLMPESVAHTLPRRTWCTASGSRVNHGKHESARDYRESIDWQSHRFPEWWERSGSRASITHALVICPQTAVVH